MAEYSNFFLLSKAFLNQGFCAIPVEIPYVHSCGILREILFYKAFVYGGLLRSTEAAIQSTLFHLCFESSCYTSTIHQVRDPQVFCVPCQHEHSL